MKGHLVAVMPRQYTEAMWRSMDEQRSGLRMMAVCRPASIERASDEVKRRAAVFAAQLDEEGRPPRRTPLAMAFDSVAHDLALGSL